MTTRNKSILLLAVTLLTLIALAFVGNGLRETSSTKNLAASASADHTAHPSSKLARSATTEKSDVRTHDKCIDAEEACLPPEPPPVLPLTGATILLDAGHGGTDTGAIRNGIQEKDINLSVTLKLRDVLVKQGARVILTRDTDVFLTLDERKALIALHKPTLFVSVHSNASTNPAIDGIEAYYFNDESDVLAQSIYQAVIDGLGEHGNWVRKRELAVVHHEFSPAALIEIGYLSNAKERSLLVKDDYQTRVADSIYEGILKYVSGRHPGADSNVTPPPPSVENGPTASLEQSDRRPDADARRSASALPSSRMRIGPALLVQR